MSVRYSTHGLDANECREVVANSGPLDGNLLGYVIYRSWGHDEKKWFAYRLENMHLMFVGKSADADGAAMLV